MTRGNSKRSTMALTASLLAATSVHAGDARTDEAPFGLAWGPVTDVPRPSLVDREANLTALFYLKGRGPATGAGTAEVILVVCREQGLRQIVWVGVPLSGELFAKARRAIHDEGVRRYGEPRPGPSQGSEIWPDGRAVLASRDAPDGQRELVMTAFGPAYAACSDAHRAETGHPADAHVADLIGEGR